ncbi:MocR-like pyridoxine biosynthesis transcription factor PdxR [Necropsobacter massiliensis]|uniref:MocR-like pyridoxine biosynthesis transcription factor PdxR n=1 Tax=Necropsobacter massiliensis TaxID=1400001 RepID=UPI000595F694|nr:PLP-dependent aminotransferase family protein [Necropsobacter massiliensis]
MKKLSYRLSKTLDTPLYLQLYQQIKQAICRQELTFGERLPSKEQLKEYLQISRNTVESAYQQLMAEGYIQSQPRKGFFVCFQAELEFNPQKRAKKSPHFAPLPAARFDFNPNSIDTRHFPLQSWKKCGRYCYTFQRRELLSLGDKQGDPELRAAIADYLSASRGVHCSAQQIVIGAGVESCLQQLILLFNQRYPQAHFSYAMENYGYTKVEKLLRLYGKNVVKLPISAAEQPLDFSFLSRHNVNVAYVTPSHLYPFGQVLSISQRQQLLEWARARQDRYIIEDDYDSEFRYKGKPIPSLQSLDFGDKVIYLGSFSKLLMPALRISFMVLPKGLLADYAKHCDFFHASVSRFEQQRLAEFMRQGEFERHIHRMRKRYRKKMELLCALLAPYKDQIRYYGEHSGFYLLLELLHASRTSVELSALAQQREIKLYPVEYENKCLFSMGFGDLTEQQLESAVEILLDIWQIT